MAEPDCAKTAGSLIAGARKLVRLSHVAVREHESTSRPVTLLKLLSDNENKSFFVCFLILCLSLRLCASCSALRATIATPKEDLHMNQMDSAWVDYLPGHEIRCK